MKFPSHLNCDGKIVSEMGPCPRLSYCVWPQCFRYILLHFLIPNNSTNTMQFAKFWMITNWNLQMRVKNILALNLNYDVIFIDMGYMSSVPLLRQIGSVKCRQCTFVLIVCVNNLIHRQSVRNFIQGLFSQKFQPWARHWRLEHDDVIKWEHFPRYWPFVRGIHRWPVNSPHKGQWRGALMFSLICALNKRLSKQSWGWWFETPSCS